MERKNKKTKSVGNGEGSLYYSETLQAWVFQYVVNGSRKTMKQKKNEKVKDFKARVTKLKNELNTETYIEKSNETFISILKSYVEQKHNDGITSDRSYGRELSTIKQIEMTCDDFINKPIQKITVEDIEKSKKNIRKYSNAVISKIWILINKTFLLATSRRKIAFNIMLDETLRKPISERPEQKIEALTVVEEKKLIDILTTKEVHHKYSSIILLQLYTGMRIGEVLALSKDCIDFKNNTLTVYRTLTQDDNFHVIMGEHTKTYKKSIGIDKGKRTFPMNNRVLALLKNILSFKVENINSMLFWDYKKDFYITPCKINSYLKRINEKYQITSSSIHSHRLRHTFITRCVESGMNQKVIQNLVGHVKGSAITSDVYTSVSDDFMLKELKKMG